MWETLKKILKTSNDKAIIIEDGQPRYVVLSIEEYTKLTGSTLQESPISDLQPQQPPVDLTDVDAVDIPLTIELSDEYGSDITIEDLPI